MSTVIKVLVGAATVAGVFEVVDGPTLGNLPGIILAEAFGIGFLVCAYVLQRRPRDRWPAGVLALLFLVEVLGVPMYERTGAVDYVTQFGFGAFALAGLVSSVVVLWQGRRSATAEARG